MRELCCNLKEELTSLKISKYSFQSVTDGNSSELSISQSPIPGAACLLKVMLNFLFLVKDQRHKRDVQILPRDNSRM